MLFSSTPEHEMVHETFKTRKEEGEEKARAMTSFDEISSPSMDNVQKDFKKEKDDELELSFKSTHVFGCMVMFKAREKQSISDASGICFFFERFIMEKRRGRGS